MSNGHGLDPKWESRVDQWTREILETMGGRLNKLNLEEDELELGKVAIARALIYAGGSIIFEHTGRHGEAAKEMIEDIINAFCAEM